MRITNITVAASAIMGILVSTYMRQADSAQYQNFTSSIRRSPTLTIQSGGQCFVGRLWYLLTGVQKPEQL